MMPASDTDYKSLFSQLIKKQMLVLGPDITLAKVKNVIGITVDINGDVQKIEGDPQQLLQGLINQFVELSGMIVKKTMESILTSYPGMMAMASSMGGGVQASTEASPVSTAQTASPAPSTDSPTAADVTAIPVSEDSAKPQEPPSMADMHLDSLHTDPPKVDKAPEEPTNFSSEEMKDLNKALEELSKAPLSTETPTSQQPQV
jgi:hypothetical protein